MRKYSLVSVMLLLCYCLPLTLQAVVGNLQKLIERFHIPHTPMSSPFNEANDMQISNVSLGNYSFCNYPVLIYAKLRAITHEPTDIMPLSSNRRCMIPCHALHSSLAFTWVSLPYLHAGWTPRYCRCSTYVHGCLSSGVICVTRNQNAVFCNVLP